MELKSLECVFIGYTKGIKGYKLYNIKSRRAFYGKDVVFHEKEKSVGIIEDMNDFTSPIQHNENLNIEKNQKTSIDKPPTPTTHFEGEQKVQDHSSFEDEDHSRGTFFEEVQMNETFTPRRFQRQHKPRNGLIDSKIAIRALFIIVNCFN